MTDVIKSAAKKAKAHTMYFVEKNRKKRRVPGVTTITDVMNKPALVPWANTIGLMGINVREYVDDLAEAGKCCHLMCELHCKGVKDPSKHEDMSMFTKDQIDLAETGFIKFLEWQEMVGFKALRNEIELTHSDLMYGGTIDIFGEITKQYRLDYGVVLNPGARILVDIKTSKGIFGEHKTQVAGGYSLLLEHKNCHYDAVIILRIGRNPDEGFEDIHVTPYEVEIHQKRFKICRELYEINKLCNRR